MVQRAQCWHLPDPVDPTPVEQGITVYFTRLRVGGIDFAILEDRKFKTAPLGKIPQMGPRPDHINDPRLRPLVASTCPGSSCSANASWRSCARGRQDWSGAEMKCVLSQTAFCGAVHLHGSATTACSPISTATAGRSAAATRPAAIRRALRRAPLRRPAPRRRREARHRRARRRPLRLHEPRPREHVLRPLVASGSTKSRAPNPVPAARCRGRATTGTASATPSRCSPMRIPRDRRTSGSVPTATASSRFDKASGLITFECWPRFSTGEQFPGWPITVRTDDNDGRKISNPTSDPAS
jgi:hypothetical protein